MSKKHKKHRQDGLKQCTLYVDGMHCASCEILIEKKLLKQEGIESVDASLAKGKVQMVYSGVRPDVTEINKEFKERGYVFSDREFYKEPSNPLFTFKSSGELVLDKKKMKGLISTVLIAFVLFTGFILLQRSNLAALVSVNESSSLVGFFLFGLIAGTSTCAALVGGLLLSMAKNWNEVYIAEDSLTKRSQPHWMFNIGRLISFPILGGVLGLLGGVLQISTNVTAVIAIGVSLLMFVLALQMLGVNWANKFQFTLPKSLTGFAADEDNFKGKFMPFIVGALTFFLPCGFTIIAQGLALSSGSFVNGALIMFFFALGTLPMLAAISYSSVKFNEKPHFTAEFNKIAGLLVLFFALFNFNSQLNVLGLPSLSDLKIANQETTSEINDELPPIVDGVQVVSMTADAQGYNPSSFKVRAEVPVRWEIEDIGTAGCTSGLIAPGLVEGDIKLKPGTNVAEFTAPKPGKYKFSCWMGMINGVIEAI